MNTNTNKEEKRCNECGFLLKNHRVGSEKCPSINVVHAPQPEENNTDTEELLSGGSTTVGSKDVKITVKPEEEKDCDCEAEIFCVHCSFCGKSLACDCKNAPQPEKQDVPSPSPIEEETKRIVFEALGEISAIFMSQEVKGTEIVMPTEELEKIGNELINFIIQKHLSYNQGVADGKREVEAKERFRAFEILHKYALETETTEMLDILEKAQKEILSNTLSNQVGNNK